MGYIPPPPPKQASDQEFVPYGALCTGGGRGSSLLPAGGAAGCGQVLMTGPEGQLRWADPTPAPVCHPSPIMKCGYCGTKSLKVITQCPHCAATTKLEMLQ